MVKKIAIFLGYLSFFILALVYFTPKTSLYYLAEEKLKIFDVVISNELLRDKGFSLEIDDATINIKSIQSAKIQESEITILGLYNNLKITNIELASTAKAFVPLNINLVNIKHTVLNPLYIDAYAKGEFGDANIMVNILDRSITIKLLPSKLMLSKYANTLKNLKKSENGEFIYEKTF